MGRLLGGLAVLVLTVSAIAFGQAPSGLPSTAKGDWTYYNADIKGSKYSPLDQINAANFNKLEVAWRFKTDMLGPRPEYKLEGTPVAVNGVLYTTGGTGRAAIAVTIIGGQSLCLFLTLLLVPVAYVQFDALERAIVSDAAKAWLGRVSAATIGRFRPAPSAR